MGRNTHNTNKPGDILNNTSQTSQPSGDIDNRSRPGRLLKLKLKLNKA